MKRRWRLFVVLVLLLVVGVSFLLPSVHWRVIGWVKGEAFYQDRPTSYWRREALKLSDWQGEQISGQKPREPSWVEKLLPPDGPFLFANKVSEGDAALVPVLTEMLTDEDPRVRTQAEWGLKKLGSLKGEMK
jgi:hypothetical protein